MSRRRHVLSLAALVLGAALAWGCSEATTAPAAQSDETDMPDGARAATVRVRMMAANITSGNNQSYLDPGIRIFKGVAPDVVMIQEFNYGSNSAADLRSFVDQAFGPGFYYWREAGAQIPNGIVSRYPIVDSGEWDDPEVTNRDFAWARIDIPGPTDLYAVSVHLLTSSSSERSLEAQSLLSHLQQLQPGAFVVLGGDFNTKDRGEPCIGTLSQALVTAGPYPADRNGNDRTNATRAQPYDWVVANPALDALEVPVAIGTSTFTSGLVADTRVYLPLAEIAPAQASDSGAVNMQHMGVVRDFAVPSTETTPSPTLAVTSPNGGESWAAGDQRSIAWTAQDVASVKVEVSLDGTSWTTVADGVPASAGQVGWTVPGVATSAARARVSDSATGRPTDTSDGPFTITVAPAPRKVFMNEILANEPGSDQAGEFVEIVNGGAAAVDLGGWTISDARAVRHVFAAGTLLAAGRALVVYGHESGIPDGVADAIGSSTGLLSLTNSGDTVTLADAAKQTVDTVSYSSALAAKDGVSMNRKPDADPAGSFVLHTTLVAASSSPDRHADGTPFGQAAPPPPPPPPGGGALTAEVEPNDGASAANAPVGNGVAVAGQVASATDADWFQVTVTSSARLAIAVAIDGNADLDWYLYRADAPTQYVTRGYTVSNPESKTYDASAGTYLIKVVGYLGATAPYRLTVSAPAGTIEP